MRSKWGLIVTIISVVAVLTMAMSGCPPQEPEPDWEMEPPPIDEPMPEDEMEPMPEDAVDVDVDEHDDTVDIEIDLDQLEIE